MNQQTKHAILFIGIISVLILAAGVRFHLLGNQSLWHDEGNSYVQATRSFGDIADNASRDIHPPGYYWLLKIWMKLTGETEFALRVFSAFASIITVAVTFAIGKQLFTEVPGLAAASFVALNSFSIYYAQEARMYALLAMWAALAMWVFVIVVKSQGTNRNWAIALALFNVAGLYTQYAFPFVMLAQGILFIAWIGNELTIKKVTLESTINILKKYQSFIQIYILTNIATLILFAPWASTAWEQVTNWPNTGESVSFSEAFSNIIADLAYGVTAGEGTSIIIVFFLLFGLLQLPQDKKPRIWWYTLVPVLWTLVAVGLFLMMDLYRPANIKFLLPTQIGFALWLGRGVWILWRITPRRLDHPLAQRVPRIAAVFGGLALLSQLWSGIDPLYNDIKFKRDDYRAIVELITEQANPDDAIILAAPNQQEVFDYYYDGDIAVYPLPRGLGGDDDATLSEVQTLIDEHERIYAVLWSLGERDPNNIVEGTLDSEAFEVSDEWYGNVRLVQYITPVEFTDTQEANMLLFGDNITLERYSLHQGTDYVQLQVEWSTDTQLDTSYKVFVQLLNPDGTLALQRDAIPGGGLYPTYTWQPNETIIDNHALIFPDDLPAANYSLIIGLYNDAGTRLLTTEERDNLLLDEIIVEN